MESNTKKKTLLMKIVLTFTFMLIMFITMQTKSYGANRIVYRITPESMTSYKVSLRWSSVDEGNIQVTAFMKEDDNTVAVYYKAYAERNVRDITIDTKSLGMNMTLNRPNIILRNQAGQSNTLLDLPQDEEMRRAISNLYAEGIINGYDDGTFKPNNYITKEEFSSMFFGLMNYNLDTTMQTKFYDVANDRWSKNIIMTLYKEGVITGQDDGNFGWAKNVSLGEVSTMIARAKNLPLLPGYTMPHNNTFHWANEYISKMYTNGLIKSTDSFYYSTCQNLNLTRGQVAIIMNR